MARNTTWKAVVEGEGLFTGKELDLANFHPKDEEKVFLVVDEYGSSRKVHPTNRTVREKGISIFVYADDFMYAVFQDGIPMFSFYVSTRGKLYQAGLYVHEEEKHYWSNNITKENESKGWQEGKSIDSEVARDFLLGEK